MGSHRHVEIETVVDPVGFGAAHVIGHPRGPQHWAGRGIGDRPIAGQNAYPDAARAQDLVAGEEVIQLVDLVRQTLLH